MRDQPPGRLRSVHQNARRDIGDDDDGNQPAENKFDGAFEYNVGITSKIHYVVITPNKALGSNDPEAGGGEGKEDRVMNSYAEKHCHQVKGYLAWARNNVQPVQRVGDDGDADQCVDYTVEAELPDGGGKLAIYRLEKDKVEFPGSNEFGKVDEVGEEEALENLADNLMGSDEQNHLPLCPVADLAHLTENDLDKDQLPDEPERLQRSSREENST